jgi:hypothetical protein
VYPRGSDVGWEEVAMLALTENSRSDAADRSRGGPRLDVLAALYGGLGDDLLPGVEPLLDVATLLDRPWPHGWVSG